MVFPQTAVEKLRQNFLQTLSSLPINILVLIVISGEKLKQTKKESRLKLSEAVVSIPNTEIKERPDQDVKPKFAKIGPNQQNHQ